MFQLFDKLQVKHNITWASLGQKIEISFANGQLKFVTLCINDKSNILVFEIICLVYLGTYFFNDTNYKVIKKYNITIHKFF